MSALLVILRFLAAVLVAIGVMVAFVGFSQGLVPYVVVGVLLVAGPGFWLKRSAPER